MTSIAQPGILPDEHRASRLTRSGVAWAMIECGRFPYSQLMSGVIFLPYFAAVVVGDPVNGQAEVATLGKVAGVAAAMTAPFLGAMIDKIGPRKPWLAGGTFIMAFLLSLLWWAEPAAQGLPIWGILAILIGVKILYAYTELLGNAMLIRAAEGRSVSRVSSVSFAFGYGTALLTLLGFLYAFALPAQYQLSWLPDEPLFGLNPLTYEHVRIAGPIAGMAMALGILPLLFFSRDHEPTNVPFRSVFRAGFDYLRTLPSHIKAHPNAGLFIFARMIYADGVAAMSMFIGILAAGVMGWGVVELLVMGLVQLSFALAGSFAAGALEERLESKRSVQLGLISAIITLSIVVGTSPQQIFFFWNDPALQTPVWNLGIFETIPQLLFLGLVGWGTFSAVMVSTGSRSLLTKITPPEETGAFFGLYALASTATAWLAPLLIGYVTLQTGSQRWGFAPVVLFFAIGLLLLSFVRQERR